MCVVRLIEKASPVCAHAHFVAILRENPDGALDVCLVQIIVIDTPEGDVEELRPVEEGASMILVFGVVRAHSGTGCLAT